MNADFGHASGSLGVGGQEIIDLETAQKLFQIATIDEDPAAQSDLDQALVDASDAHQLGLADEDLTWTTDVAGKDKTFRTGQVTDDKVLSIDLSTYDKTFYQSRAAHQKTLKDANSSSLSTLWNDEAAAASARFLSQSEARADFLAAQHDAAATALATFATTLGTPWAQFRADLAVAQRDWWWNGCTGQKTDYLAWAADANTEAEEYQTSLGTKFVTEMGNVTSADVTWWNTTSDALHTYTTESMTALETYVQGIAPKIEDYHVGVATADKDVLDQGESFDYQGAIDSALKTHAQEQAAQGGDHKVAQATAKRDLVDRIEGNNLVGIGTGGANKTRQAAVDAAVEALKVYEAQEYAQLVTDVANLDASYRTAESRSWADAVAQFALNHPSPWADYEAAKTDADADLILIEAAEDAAVTIAEAEAERDYLIGQYGAEGDLSASGVDALAIQTYDSASAAVTLAAAQRDTATARAGSAAIANGGEGSGPEMSARPEAVASSVLQAAASLFGAVGYATGVGGWINTLFGISETGEGTLPDENDLDPYGGEPDDGNYLQGGCVRPGEPTLTDPLLTVLRRAGEGLGQALIHDSQWADVMIRGMVAVAGLAQQQDVAEWVFDNGKPIGEPGEILTLGHGAGVRGVEARRRLAELVTGSKARRQALPVSKPAAVSQPTAVRQAAGTGKRQGICTLRRKQLELMRPRDGHGRPIQAPGWTDKDIERRIEEIRAWMNARSEGPDILGSAADLGKGALVGLARVGQKLWSVPRWLGITDVLGMED
ncbi:MAG: hypothetical protein ACYTG0_05050, partial [Planctomycetota bacterium]